MATETVVHAGTPAFNGLSEEQVLMVLESIATTANVAVPIAERLAEALGLTNEAQDAFVLVTLAQRVGALADHVLGGDCVGGIGEWMAGESFSDAGKGVQHVE